MIWVGVGLFGLMLLSAVASGLLERAEQKGRRWVGYRGRMAVVGAGAVGFAGVLFLPLENVVVGCVFWVVGPVFGVMGLVLLGLALFGPAERVAGMMSNSLGRTVPPAEVGPPPVRWPHRPDPPPADAGFLAAIKAAPDDDTLRLVYADWLDERSDPRGELVRAEVGVRQGEPGAAERFWFLMGTTDPEWAARIVRPASREP